MLVIQKDVVDLNIEKQTGIMKKLAKIFAVLLSMMIVLAGIVSIVIKENDNVQNWLYILLFIISSIVLVYPSIKFWDGVFYKWLISSKKR